MMRKLLRCLYWGLGAFGFLTLASVGAAYWSPQLAAGGVTAINGFVGAFNLGAGLAVNVPWIVPQPGTHLPWQPYSNQGVITQTSGTVNALRNSSGASWDHYRYLTKDNPGGNAYHIGIASLTGATIDNGSGSAGTFLEAPNAPTGNPALWQRVTDDGNNVLQTTGATAVPTVGSPTCSNALASCQLQFLAGTVSAIVTGMYAYDQDNPRAIAGNITVDTVNNVSGVVKLTAPVGFQDNTSGSNSNKSVAPGVSNGDHIAFSTIKRGTQIVGFGTCTDPWTVSCHYIVNTTQLVGSAETMQTAGGWCQEGVYIIPVGTAGTSNYVTCSGGSASTIVGVNATTGSVLTVTGSLSDVIIRWPIDYVDALRFNCATYAGAILNCVNSNTDIQPVTFQVMITYGNNSTSSVPYIQTWTACPLNSQNPVNTNICADTWTTATPDLVTTSIGALSNCHESSTPVTCTYAYTWTPTGTIGGYEVEYHTGSMAAPNALTIEGFELKQTPGATCAQSDGSIKQPPCFQAYPGALDIAEVTADVLRNRRFTQTIGAGWETAINAGNTGFVETASGFAFSTTQFYAAWPLPVAMRCDTWHTSTKGAPVGTPSPCPQPNFYATVPGDYQILTNGGLNTGVTALSVYKYGLGTVGILATTTGLTTDKPGLAQWGNGNGDFMMLDSSEIGH